MPKRFLPLVLLSVAGFMLACVLSTGYRRTGGSYVYATLDEGRGYIEHPIDNIDARSFQILNRNGYARDDRQVYYHEHTLEGADPNSFTAMTDLYGRDNARVYFEGRPVPGADPATFTLFDIQWGKDSQDVYFQDRPVGACDPASFVLLKESWERDNRCIYRLGIRLPQADPASFEVLNYWFGKDKAHVYYNSPKIIEGADPATFKLRDGICVVCGEDRNGCYRYEEPVACEALK
jgi:hypothetical protein